MAYKRCPRCKKRNAAEATFCGECGAALTVPARSRKTASLRCHNPDCRFDRNPPTATYCVKCGTVLHRPPPRRLLAFLLVPGAALIVMAALAIAAVLLWQAGLIQEWVPNLPEPVARLIAQVAEPTPTRPRTSRPADTVITLNPVTETLTPAVTPTPSLSPTATSTGTPTSTPTATAKPTVTPTVTDTPTPTAPATRMVEVAVQASVGRNDPGLLVAPGQHIVIEYLSGSWRAGSASIWSLVGPQGDSQVLSKSSFPVPGARIMSLVGGIGDGRAFLVSDRIEFDSMTGGRLWLGPNDDVLTDNAGSLIALITVGPSSPTRVPIPTGSIVFTCYVGDYDQICIMNADGANERRLTNTAATDFYASFSPDGEQIVFSSRRDDNFELYLMDADGSNQRRLSENLGELYAPAISPDGQRMVFTSARGGNQNIWVMNLDGSGAVALTNTDGNNVDPVWSPDGTRIAFASDRDGETAHYVMNTDGSSLGKLETGVEQLGGRSDWSPDGRWLAFYAGPQSDRDIYLVAVDGSEVRRLTTGGDNAAPSFSPDGNWIAFVSERDGDLEIFIMRPDGSHVTQLTFNNRPDWQPRWGPSTNAGPGQSAASVPTPAPTPCAVAAHSTFSNVWQGYAALLGCPKTAAKSNVWTAEEHFRGGLTFWREDNDKIYVLYNSGSWQQFANSWREGDPSFSCGAPESPPTPQRGFGKLWCASSGVRTGQGDTTTAEWGEQTTVQEFHGGLILRSPSAQVYVLLNDGSWR